MKSCSFPWRSPRSVMSCMVPLKVTTRRSRPSPSKYSSPRVSTRRTLPFLRRSRNSSRCASSRAEQGAAEFQKQIQLRRPRPCPCQPVRCLCRSPRKLFPAPTQIRGSPTARHACCCSTVSIMPGKIWGMPPRSGRKGTTATPLAFSFPSYRTASPLRSLRPHLSKSRSHRLSQRPSKSQSHRLFRHPFKIR